ncbi:MAG: LysM peptidoglycan-binding domain-containing protein [Burkholderiales bacterium]
MISLHRLTRHTLYSSTLIAVLALGQAWANNLTVTPTQRDRAELVALSGVALTELAENAPDSYTVKRGDTLWDISTLFLKRPWSWPELWGMNKEQIKNPHLIYPGQVLLLVKSEGRATLRMAQQVAGASSDVVKLSPRIRAEDVRAKAIASIPAGAIEPFLSRPLIVEQQGLDSAPRIVATQEGRVFTGANDIIYVRGLNANDTHQLFDVFRPGRPLKDPDTQAVVGYEAVYLGAVQKTRPGDPATFRIVNSKEEIGVGDRLVAAGRPEVVNYVPRAVGKALDGRVLSIYGGGVDQAATNMVIALNRGSAQGLERGHVLRMMRYGKTIVDKTSVNKKEQVRLPDEPYAMVFVFRVFKDISYGLIFNATAPVMVGDSFTSRLE